MGAERRVGAKTRLDVLMVERGLAESREQAQRLILAGKVRGPANPKPGMKVPADAVVELVEGERYVSRGGLKLEAALRSFGIDLGGRICADIGASTGGFTDCMLQHGAARVYAVDVGKSQMHERVRGDQRVVLVEHTNARELTAGSLPETVSFVAVDVSFISLEKILGPLACIASPAAEAVFLVKPQFESTREEVSRGKGVIRSPEIHERVIEKVRAAAMAQGWVPVNLAPSPIEGGSGNREFLLFCRKTVR